MNKTEYLKQIDRVIERGQYKDNWDSMRDIPIPEWYKNAKFGLFVHWGLYSIPAFKNEWYARNMHIKDSLEYNHHCETYGSDFAYKDFVPLFKAEKFSADEWLELFEKSGAKYLMPVAEHHDGFQMYKSALSEFNVFNMGAKRDILGELKQASKKRGIRFCASSHRIENWWFLDGEAHFDQHCLYPPSPPSAEFMEDWLVRTAELIDNYQPEILYFDWWIQITAMKPYVKKISAYYYNRGLEWGKPAAINYKHDAFAFGCAVLDVERGQFASVKPNFWQTCASMATNSWCYTSTNIYKSSRSIICDLIDIVSKNGSLLLNVGPKASGEISDEEQKILLEIGDWLDVNGESIYNTRPFRIFGEGVTEIKEGHNTDGTEKPFTSQDIRFTQNGNCIYAAVLKYPEEGIVRIKSLAERAPDFHGIIENISVLGFGETPDIIRTSDYLELKTKSIKSEFPVVFKITIL